MYQKRIISFFEPRVCNMVTATPQLQKKVKRHGIILDCTVIGSDLLDMMVDYAISAHNAGLRDFTLTYGRYCSFTSILFASTDPNKFYEVRLNRQETYELEQELGGFMMEHVIKLSKM